MSTRDSSPGAGQSWRRSLRPVLLSPLFQRALLALLLSLALAFLMIDFVRVPGAGLQVGDIADRDVIATQSFELLDDEATRLRREQAARAVHTVYEQDAQASRVVMSRLHAAFEYGRARLAEDKSAAELDASNATATPGTRNGASRSGNGSVKKSAATPRQGRSGEDDALDGPRAELDPILQDPLVQRLDQFRPTMAELLGAELTPELFARFVHLHFDRVIEDIIGQLVTDAMAHPVLVELAALSDSILVNGITLAKIDEQNRTETVLYLRDGLMDLESARKSIEDHAQVSLSGRPGWQIRAIAELAGRLIQPTVTVNDVLTEQRRREASESVSPVKIPVKKGTMIVRRGDPIDDHKFFLLQSIAQLQADYHPGAMFLSVTLLVYVLLGTCYAFAATYIRKFASSGKDLITVSLLLFVVLALTRASVEVSNALASYLPFVQLNAYYYGIPLATGAMVVRILMNSETALLFSIILSILAAMLLEYNGLYLAFYFVSSLAAAGGIAHTKERVHVLRGGLVAGVVNVLMVLAIHMVHAATVETQRHPSGESLLLELAFAFGGGLVASILTLGIVPFFEMFGYVTDYKLLELANLNHPLLKDLMLKAPGTYHHSVIVGNLSEAAAQAIRANALLARVGCLYHDIGKMKKPEYFIENLRNVTENRHDHMPAHMSALIIASHVRDGIEMARQHRLPQAIIDLIPGHHGTSLISYFYNKARQEAGSGEQVNENDFRYPGPKPRTREAGIVMLADATEASTRSIKNVNVSKIRINLQKIFQRVISDGQLDECPITLHELAVIMESFQKTLEAIYHNRIEYPPDLRPGASMAGIGTGAVLSLESDALSSMPVPASVLQETNRKLGRTTDVTASTTLDSMPMLPISARTTVAANGQAGEGTPSEADTDARRARPAAYAEGARFEPSPSVRNGRGGESPAAAVPLSADAARGASRRSAESAAAPQSGLSVEPNGRPLGGIATGAAGSRTGAMDSGSVAAGGYGASQRTSSGAARYAGALSIPSTPPHRRSSAAIEAEITVDPIPNPALSTSVDRDADAAADGEENAGHADTRGSARTSAASPSIGDSGADARGADIRGADARSADAGAATARVKDVSGET